MKSITNIDQLDTNLIYSYADYLKWKFEERLELFKGKIFKMSPGPNTSHQRVSVKLSHKLLNFFEDKSCQLFYAPFDVRLLNANKSTKDKDIYTVVQPDLCVICDLKKIDKRGCIGAPDLVIEILSPGNTNKEMKNKFQLYQEAGVREYWIVEPNDRTILVYILKDDIFIGLAPVTDEDILTCHIFPELKIVTKDIFI